MLGREASISIVKNVNYANGVLVKNSSTVMNVNVVCHAGKRIITPVQKVNSSETAQFV